MESNTGENLNPCSIGLALNEDCHLNTIFRGSHALINATDLSKEKKVLLEWRTAVEFADDNTICNHHEKKYISYYERLQRQCCDPFKRHKKAITKSLRVIEENDAKLLNVKPGQKLCPTCRNIKISESC
ncbi:ARL14 effector protein-like [Antedon mediterranea]|uniref:ARL14 effector protein-like n=1 Tax=Antedon mediterranea TaxID=105859 RepID=UPI003AF5E747